MFDRLFVRPTALRRHRTAPMLKERLDYLAFLAERGQSFRSLQFAASYLLVVIDYLRLADSPGKTYRREEIELKAARWANRRSSKLTYRRGTSASRANFLWWATDWLRFLGRLEEKPALIGPLGKKIAAFADAMHSERGFSPATIYGRSRFLQCFLHGLGNAEGAFHRITITEVDAALLEMLHSRKYVRASVVTFTNHLRAFFRFAERCGWCQTGLAAAIRPPRIFKYTSLPTGPSWQDVQRLLATTEGNRPADIRDRAMLMLFSVYGLRSGEVRHLRLEDFDWERQVLTVAGSKSRRTRTYPLTRQVGDAVLRYLKVVRPRSVHREVFLALQAPIQPLQNVKSIVARRWERLGVSVPHAGPHALRHACAAHLVARGLSLKEIGDHLGHRHSDATRIYAKVDLAGLRQVADFDLGGLS